VEGFFKVVACLIRTGRAKSPVVTWKVDVETIAIDAAEGGVPLLWFCQPQ
jgi:hypothetical protein